MYKLSLKICNLRYILSYKHGNEFAPKTMLSIVSTIVYPLNAPIVVLKVYILTFKVKRFFPYSTFNLGSPYSKAHTS